MASDFSYIFEDVGGVLEAFESMKLPSWDALPDLPLYMDQVMVLMDRFLRVDVPGAPEQDDKDSRILTSSMVNNYVKMGIMPAPEKKKYGRTHLAYLLMICILKQSFSIPVLGMFINTNVEEMGIEAFYNLFVESYEEYYGMYIRSLINVYDDIFHKKGAEADRVRNEAVMSIAAVACANAGKLTCDTADIVISQAEEARKKEKK